MASTLKRFLRITRTEKVIQATKEMEEKVWKLTKVLLVPSIQPEGFGLVATEAQLRGIPCVSTNFGGLQEANRVPDCAKEVEMVFDLRTREIKNFSMQEADEELELGRPGQLSMEQIRQAEIVKSSNEKVAEEEDCEALAEVLRPLLEEEERLKAASAEACSAAREFVRSRQGKFAETIRKVVAEEPDALGDLPPLLGGKPVKPKDSNST